MIPMRRAICHRWICSQGQEVEVRLVKGPGKVSPQQYSESSCTYSIGQMCSVLLRLRAHILVEWIHKTFRMGNRDDHISEEVLGIVAKCKELTANEQRQRGPKLVNIGCGSEIVSHRLITRIINHRHHVLQFSCLRTSP